MNEFISTISDWLFNAVQNNFWWVVFAAWVTTTSLLVCIAVIVSSWVQGNMRDKLFLEKFHVIEDLEMQSACKERVMRERFMEFFLPLINDSRNAPFLKSILLRIEKDNLAAYSDWLLISKLINALIDLLFPDKHEHGWYAKWDRMDTRARRAGDRYLKSINYALKD